MKVFKIKVRFPGFGKEPPNDVVYHFAEETWDDALALCRSTFYQPEIREMYDLGVIYLPPVKAR
jgi:hypothetical protein